MCKLINLPKHMSVLNSHITDRIMEIIGETINGTSKCTTHQMHNTSNAQHIECTTHRMHNTPNAQHIKCTTYDVQDTSFVYHYRMKLSVHEMTFRDSAVVKIKSVVESLDNDMC